MHKRAPERRIWLEIRGASWLVWVRRRRRTSATVTPRRVPGGSSSRRQALATHSGCRGLSSGGSRSREPFSAHSSALKHSSHHAEKLSRGTTSPLRQFGQRAAV